MRSDEELLRACQQTNSRAQTILYDRHKARLMGLCRRYARNREEAEDMFHEGFIRIFQQLHTLQQADRLLPWMKRVMVNSAINVYHKNLKQRAEIDAEVAFDQASDAHTDVLARLSADELTALVSALPGGYRMVFNLYVVDGYTHPEIAQLLGIAEGTSKSQLARARALLKHKLSQLGIVSYENP
ncbi:MAG: sigma-70 family RNA polymerase sigma factor [Bacteroidetes bacterium]|nr:sigma-70 family RNA polymerase sigma factor [Fibrella sp.]